jgi:hypothetical protein
LFLFPPWPEVSIRRGRDFLRWRFRSSSVLYREDDLSDFELVAFLDANLAHDAAHRRRYFDDGLVRFQFHHGLAFFDVGAGRNHQANQIALLNVFAQLGQFEFRHCPQTFLS